MEVLNAAGLTPASIPKAIFSHDRKSEPRKLPSLSFPKSPSSSHFRLPSLGELLPRGLGAGLAALSSALASGVLAKALTYEEAIGQTVGVDSSVGSINFDVAQFLDGSLNFASENPLVVGGGAAVLAVPLVLSQILQKPKPWGVQTAKSAYAKLSDDPEAQLLDIREGREFKEVGSPDVRKLKKKAVSIAYRGDDKPGFLKKLALKFNDPGNTTLFILDKFDGNSELVAELVTANGFKAAFAIKDGAEGARGWMNSGLPWSPPRKGPTIEFDGLRDAISDILGESSDGLPVALGLAAATGLGLFAFTEMETALQVLGSAAIIQLVTKKFLFAEDRKVSLQQLDEFVNTKVAPKELVEEIKMIGQALLPAPNRAKSLPAPAEPTTNAVPEVKPELKAETAPEPPVQVNSVPVAEAEKESLPGMPRPLSPYPYYPDYKPPSSPSPSAP